MLDTHPTIPAMLCEAMKKSQMAMAQGTSQPVIEVGGQLQFSLPGEPRFPALADDTILKPTLDWRIHAEKAAKLDAELCYVTGGMSWEADYNVVSPEKGDVMDLVGERKRTNIRVDSSNHWIDESFEIKVRNRKQDEAVEIRVVEHLYRWTNWEIREPSNAFEKKDAQTIEFRVPLKPGEERTLTYTVHYSW